MPQICHLVVVRAFMDGSRILDCTKEHTHISGSFLVHYSLSHTYQEESVLGTLLNRRLMIPL